MRSFPFMLLISAILTALHLSAAGGGPEQTTTLIPLGTKDLTGGTTKVGEVDPNAVGTSGTTALEGTICNKLTPPREVKDLTVTVDNGEATGIVVDRTSSTTDKDTASMTTTAKPGGGKTSTATLDLTDRISGNPCRGYRLNGVKHDGSGKLVSVVITPSFKEQVAGTLLSMNATPTYHLDDITCQITSGVGAAVHGAILHPVVNQELDNGKWLTALEGSASIPSLPSATIQSVHVFDENWLPRGGAVEIAGQAYTVTNFGPVPPAGRIFVVVRFSEAPGGAGATVRSSLLARFVAAD